jgi:hypothetical protein
MGSPRAALGRVDESVSSGQIFLNVPWLDAVLQDTLSSPIAAPIVSQNHREEKFRVMLSDLSYFALVHQ